MRYVMKIITKLQFRQNHNWIKPEGYDTGIKLYNCIAKEKVPLILRNKNFTTWYTCGPTVYDSTHVGHASCYVKLDIIQRILRNYFHVNLTTVMNITDIDDKIIQKSNVSNRSPIEIARDYETEFWEDLDSLNVIRPNIVVRVTDNISLITRYIKKLIDLDKAYVGGDNSIYFNLKKYGSYGKLQNVKENNPQEDFKFKRFPNDFVLWKAAKPDEPFWDSIFGPGRPGWHIECSTLASNILGSTIDIHAGGVDLRFPHHENEEAQSCAYFSKQQWVNYWIHIGHLVLKDSVKMSKSLKNTVSVRELLKSKDANVFRMACLQSNYQNNMEFHTDMMHNAEETLKSLKFFIANCNTYIKGQNKIKINEELLLKLVSKTVEEFDLALKDNFDTAAALKSINNLIGITNKFLNSPAGEETESSLSCVAPLISLLNFVVDSMNLFGISLVEGADKIERDNEELLRILIRFRQEIRQVALEDKDQNLFKLCDGVRDNLKKIGISVNDLGKVSSWIR